MRRGPEDLLPNSHQDWADVYKFDKFMAKNWVSHFHQTDVGDDSI